MIVVNFSHPITGEQKGKIAELTGQPIERIIDAPTKIDLARPVVEQVETIIAAIGLTPAEWQTAALVVNPPALAPVTAVAIAALHGLMGYFPAILRISPRAGAVPPVFDVAEIIDLQSIRQTARDQR